MSDIADLESRLNQRFQKLDQKIDGLKVTVFALSNDSSQLNDVSAKSALLELEIRKVNEKLDRLLTSVDNLRNKVDN